MYPFLLPGTKKNNIKLTCTPGGGGGGGRNFHMKGAKMLVGNFELNP